MSSKAIDNLFLCPPERRSHLVSFDADRPSVSSMSSICEDDVIISGMRLRGFRIAKCKVVMAKVKWQSNTYHYQIMIKKEAKKNLNSEHIINES